MIRQSRDVRCAAEGCGTVISRGKLFCQSHYFSLPKPLRDELWRTWRAAMWQWKSRLSHAEQERCNREYQAAFDAAREYLRTAQPTPAVAMATVAIGADGREIHYAEGRML